MNLFVSGKYWDIHSYNNEIQQKEKGGKEGDK